MSIRPTDYQLDNAAGTFDLTREGYGHWELYDEAPPFVLNSRGHLVHRPLQLARYYAPGREHETTHLYCGGMRHLSDGNLSFVEDFDERLIVCQRCETIAVARGRRPSSEILGRHVHIGGIRAVAYCCDHSYDRLPVRKPNQ